MGNEMTRAQAKQIAKKLSAEGMKQQDIGRELAKQGFTSSRTGQALTQGGIDALLRSTAKTSRKRRTAPHRTAPHSTDLAATMRFILESSAAPEDRITLALMILEQRS